MSTIPKTLHLPLCNSATLFSDSLWIRINPEIKRACHASNVNILTETIKVN
jgi:hypothetical protein